MKTTRIANACRLCRAKFERGWDGPIDGSQEEQLRASLSGANERHREESHAGEAGRIFTIPVVTTDERPEFPAAHVPPSVKVEC